MSDRNRCVLLGLLAAAGLSMTACAVGGDMPVNQTDRPMFPAPNAQGPADVANAQAPLGTGLSIQMPPGTGKRIWMAAKADLGAVNAMLGTRGEHFVAANPQGIPNPYWGLDPTANAYMFIDVTQYPDATWTVNGTQRKGTYAVADITVYGFQLDANGARVDINQDGSVDDDDWTSLELRTTLSGTSDFDTRSLVSIEENAFGAVASGAPVSVEGVDQSGYPNRATMGSGSRQVLMQIGAGNANRCTAETEEWERCWFFGAIHGSMLATYPAPKAAIAEWRIVNTTPSWVKFDPGTDSFKVTDYALAAELRGIRFSPLYWVRSGTFSATFDSSLQ